MGYGKSVILFLVIVMVVSSVGVGVWMFKKQNTASESLEVLVFNGTSYIEIIDALSESHISSPFVMFTNGTVIGDGVSRADSLVEVDYSYWVYNRSGAYEVFDHIMFFNVDNDDYYTSPGYLEPRKRSTLYVYPVGDLAVSVISDSIASCVNAGCDGVVSLNLSVKGIGQYRQIGYCLKSSFSFLSINDTNQDHLRLLNPKRFSDYDKCYWGVGTIGNPSETLKVDLAYKLVSDIDSYDKIDIVFFDSGRNMNNDDIVENSEGKDVAGPDHSYYVDNNFVIHNTNS